MALFKYKGQIIASIAIGSGDRPNPLDASIEDKFFVLYDKSILASLSTTTLTTIPFTDLSAISSLSTPHNILNPAFKGWSKDFTLTDYKW